MTNLAPHRSWSWRIQVGVVTGALALVVMLARLVIVTPSAEARADTTFTVLYSFKGRADGSSLYAGLVRDAGRQSLWHYIVGGTSAKGTVFKLDPTDAKTVLHSFTGPLLDGQYPEADLIRDADTPEPLWRMRVLAPNEPWEVSGLDSQRKEKRSWRHG
jgi:hypothetical protein